jgi:hypothetical protein
METKKTIYTKLLEFQKLGIAVAKKGENDFFKKNGKPSKYATLNEVLDKVKEPLNELGILIIFAPEETGLRTTLLDVESDTKIESFMKYLGIDNAQKLLACNTYFRRGSLVSLLGLEDEDDDGNKASEPVKPIAPPKKLSLFEQAEKLLNECDSLEALEKTSKKIQEGKNLTEDEKKKLIGVGEKVYSNLTN